MGVTNNIGRLRSSPSSATGEGDEHGWNPHRFSFQFNAFANPLLQSLFMIGDHANTNRRNLISTAYFFSPLCLINTKRSIRNLVGTSQPVHHEKTFRSDTLDYAIQAFFFRPLLLSISHEFLFRFWLFRAFLFPLSNISSSRLTIPSYVRSSFSLCKESPNLLSASVLFSCILL